MLDQSILNKVKDLASQVAVREGCYLYDLEFLGNVLRVFIDKEGAGAGIEECTNVSRGLNLLLDVEDPISSAYNLEVSTPGLDRKLKEVWHFEKVAGQKIWIKTDAALETFGITNKKYSTAKQLSEVLVDVQPERGLHFSLEGEELYVPLASVEKGKLVFEVKESPKGKPHKGPKR